MFEELIWKRNVKFVLIHFRGRKICVSMFEELMNVICVLMHFSVRKIYVCVPFQTIISISMNPI